MKKISVYLTIIAFLFILPLIARIYAQSTGTKSSEAIMVPPDQGSGASLLFGQDHSYTVTFRGNGEAVVNMKAIFSNYEEATMSAITLRVPRITPNNLAVYQVIREKQCIRYAPQKYNPLSQTYELPNMNCLQYQEPDYYSYYDYSKTKYYKADVTLDGDTLTIQLPQGVAPESSGSYVIYYRALGYATRDIYGVYDYTFETLKTDDTIRNVTVGITTDSDLQLKGASSQVEYDVQLAAPTLNIAQKSEVGFSGAQFDSYYQRIGSGKISKYASELQPNDSFTVKGSYATSLVRLYGKNITIILTITIGLVAFLIALGHRLLQKRKTQAAVVQNKLQKPAHSLTSNILLMLFLSFASSIIATVCTIVLYIMLSFMNSISYSQFNIVIALFLLVISCMIYPIILVGPGLFMGIRRGLWWGVGTFGITIMWLGLYLCIIFLYLFIAKIGYRYEQPLQYMESTMQHQQLMK